MLRSVMVIDDEKSFAEMLRSLLSREGYDVTCLTDASHALQQLAATPFDAVLCDIQMPRMNGLDFLREFKAKGINTTVIMMSAYGTLDTAIECMKLGAYDYISKPFKADEIRLALQKVAERDGLQHENKRLKRELGGETGMENIVGSSEPMRRLFETIRKVSAYKSTVLLTGESGTGKEMVAKAIHKSSERHAQRFVAINCGAIPDNLLESELFGCIRGAYTDALRDRKGIFEEANRGTLFLDEIGELPLSLQVKLLRVIQEGEVRRVGDTQPKKVDVRIIAATIRDLEKDVQDKRFREDLFYRLNVLPIHLPALRERLEDIPALVEVFVGRSAERLGKPMDGIDPAALEILTAYHWPGNVRQLENTIERACVFSDSQTITPEGLPPSIASASDRVQLTLGRNELSIKKTVRFIEEELIRRALRKTGGNRTAAAKILEISHRALLYKIKSYEIDIPPRTPTQPA